MWTIGNFPLGECSDARTRPDEFFDGIPPGMVSHGQPSQRGIGAGDADKNGREIEFPRVLMIFFGLPPPGVQGGRYGHDGFDRKIVEEGCLEELLVGRRSNT